MPSPPRARAFAVSPHNSTESPSGHDAAALTQQNDKRNFWALATYLILLRTGWVFKTESIIMPAFLDFIAGPGWIRGVLPLLNRFGHSVPALLLARRIKILPRKKFALFFVTLGMAAMFLLLSIVLWIGDSPQGTAITCFFLVVYGLFFCFNGVSNLSNSTLHGKLLAANRRGHLMLVATTVGGLLSIIAASSFLGRWLAMPGGGFHYLFGFTGLVFFVSSVCALGLSEQPDNHTEPACGLRQVGLNAISLLRQNIHFRRLATVAFMFSTVQILFPHYQAIARQCFGLGLNQLVIWVVIQNAGTALFSIFAGPLADKRGNRIVMRVLMFVLAINPALAAGLSLREAVDPKWFWLIFLMIGITPITYRILLNYTLELCSPEDHPRYLSTMSLCVSAPFLLSPLIGYTIDMVGFAPVMLCGSVLLVAGGFLTFRLHEPRNDNR